MGKVKSGGESVTNFREMKARWDMGEKKNFWARHAMFRNNLIFFLNFPTKDHFWEIKGYKKIKVKSWLICFAL